MDFLLRFEEERFGVSKTESFARTQSHAARNGSLSIHLDRKSRFAKVVIFKKEKLLNGVLLNYLAA